MTPAPCGAGSSARPPRTRSPRSSRARWRRDAGAPRLREARAAPRPRRGERPAAARARPALPEGGRRSARFRAADAAGCPTRLVPQAFNSLVQRYCAPAAHRRGVRAVWSNMALHWLADPLPAFHEFARVLARGTPDVQHARARHRRSCARPRARSGCTSSSTCTTSATCWSPPGSLPGHGHGDDPGRLRQSGNLLADLRASGQTSARRPAPRAGRARFSRAAARGAAGTRFVRGGVRSRLESPQGGTGSEKRSYFQAHALRRPFRL